MTDTESRLLLRKRLLFPVLIKKRKSQENVFFCGYNSQKRTSIVPNPVWCRLTFVDTGRVHSHKRACTNAYGVVKTELTSQLAIL